MRRLLHSILLGLSVQGVIVPLLYVTTQTSLPPIFEYIIAPSFFLIILFAPCGAPPEMYQAYMIKGIIFGFMFNVAVYTLLAYAILRWHQNKALRLP